jgi:hypothetical protein
MFMAHTCLPIRLTKRYCLCSLNAVYGTMVAALFYYKKFVKSLTKQGCKINLYNGCMANKVVKRKQVRICFHIDDCKISYKSYAVIDDTIAWLRVK